ncbi:MAG: uroporphyrinogen-III synthase [Acidimicrobiaceae bacterium]|nr:uroporphyrinogen-III synthase [Acidimicrobiaceae bacterium]
MKVVLTRERGRNDELVAWLPEGCDVFEVPLTETHYVSDDVYAQRLDEAARAGAFSSLVLTSAKSAPLVEAALQRCVRDVEVYSVGPATTRSLGELGVVVSAQSLSGARELANQVRFGPVLIVGAATMRPELAQDLRSRALEVCVVAGYETRAIELDEDAARSLREADVVAIGAPSAWRVARAHVGEPTWVVVPGATTARVVELDHARVIEGWGPSWRVRLAELELADARTEWREQ